jgi:hypothetical protein
MEYFITKIQRPNIFEYIPYHWVGLMVIGFFVIPYIKIPSIDVWHKIICKRSSVKEFLLIFKKIVEN